MRRLLTITKALADESRLRAVGLLEGRELCLCQLIEVLELAPSTVSKHMAILCQAGLVDARKAGRWAFFRLPDENASPETRQAIDWVLSHLKRQKQGTADRQKLKAVLKIAPEELCRRQTGCKC